MSTKIFNGYKIKAQNLDEAIQTMMDSKKKIEEAYERHIIEEEVVCAISIIIEQIKESHNLLDGVVSQSIIDEINATNDAKEKQIKEAVGSDSIDLKKNAFTAAGNILADKSEAIYRSKNNEFDVRVILYPPKFEIDSANHYLFTLYAPHNLDKIFLSSTPHVSEYGYWNNTDPLDGVSDEEWEIRGNNWDRAMPSSMPVLDGFQAQFTDAVNAPYLIDNSKRVSLQQELCASPHMQEYYASSVEKIKSQLMHSILYYSSLNAEGDTIKSAMNTKNKVYDKKFNSQEWDIYNRLAKKIDLLFPANIEIANLTKPMEEVIAELKSRYEKNSLNDEIASSINTTIKIKL